MQRIVQRALEVRGRIGRGELERGRRARGGRVGTEHDRGLGHDQRRAGRDRERRQVVRDAARHAGDRVGRQRDVDPEAAVVVQHAHRQQVVGRVVRQADRHRRRVLGRGRDVVVAGAVGHVAVGQRVCLRERLHGRVAGDADLGVGHRRAHGGGERDSDIGARRRVRRRRDDHPPAAAGRRLVDVQRVVDRPHLERVVAEREIVELVRRAAARPRLALERALVAHLELVRREDERRARVRGRPGRDRRWSSRERSGR